MIPAGFLKHSFIDYPGKISCVIFASGCNFRCPYCHNPELVKEDLKAPSLFSQEYIFDFLEQRKGLLEGVVISGGEPTLTQNIFQFCTEIKNMGYMIKLDTNGSRPNVLRKFIDSGLADYVAMDIKTDPLDYSPIVVKSYDPLNILKSIQIIMSSAKEYEFRTTCVKPLIDERTMERISRQIQGASRYILQHFQKANVLDPEFIKGNDPGCSDEALERYRNIALSHVKACSIR